MSIDLFGTAFTVYDLRAVATFLALVTTTAFIFFYSRRPWRDSVLGVAIMAAAVSTALVAGAGALNRIDRRVTSMDFEDARAWAATVAWVAVAAAYGGYLVVLRRLDRADDEEGEDDEGSDP